MVVLPTGSFSMGTVSGGNNDERPVGTVNINKRIAIGRYEVTFADYDRFADAPGTAQGRPTTNWDRGDQPVINVSQADAKAYAAWLSTQTGKTYRLPSEAEWEYAVRAGTSTLYSWGDEIGINRANCSGCNNPALNQTTPVGRFAANAFGLFDMHGNVSEWVEDCYVNTYTDAPSDGSARTSGCGATVRAVVRGGAWDDFPRILRSALRLRLRPSNRLDNLGFRLVQDLNP